MNEDVYDCSRCGASTTVEDEYEAPEHGLCWPCASAVLDEELIRADKQAAQQADRIAELEAAFATERKARLEAEAVLQRTREGIEESNKILIDQMAIMTESAELRAQVAQLTRERELQHRAWKLAIEERDEARVERDLLNNPDYLTERAYLIADMIRLRELLREARRAYEAAGEKSVGWHAAHGTLTDRIDAELNGHGEKEGKRNE